MAWRAIIALLVALTALPVQLAHGQGFFQSLFGDPAPPRQIYRSPYGSPFAGPFSPYQPYRSPYDSQPYDYSGSYRTLCVRLCDGYYFPVSFNTTRSGLAADADKCAASCGDDARLFYHPNPGGDVETMVDLTGRAYATLPNAFKYRKTLVNGCQCRPKPWSEAELRRHRSYAEAQLPAPGALQPRAEDHAALPRQALDDRSSENGGTPAPVERPAPGDQALYRQPDARSDTALPGDAGNAVQRPQPVARKVKASQPWSLFGGTSSSASSTGWDSRPNPSRGR